jgi:hypothetical protein
MVPPNVQDKVSEKTLELLTATCVRDHEVHGELCRATSRTDATISYNRRDTRHLRMILDSGFYDLVWFKENCDHQLCCCR